MVGKGGTEKSSSADAVVVVVVVAEEEEGEEEEGKGLIGSERSARRESTESFSTTLGMGTQSMKYGVLSRWIYFGQKENRLTGRLSMMVATSGDM